MPLCLNDRNSGSVTWVNDGGLAPGQADEAVVSYDYPREDWLFGPVVMTPQGPNTVRETLTFTSAPLTADLDLVGPAELIVYLSSTRTDTRVIARLSEQLPQTEADRAARRAARGQGCDQGLAARRAPGTRRGRQRSRRPAPPCTPRTNRSSRASPPSCASR